MDLWTEEPSSLSQVLIWTLGRTGTLHLMEKHVQSKGVCVFISSSSSTPLLSLVTSTSEISHQPVHTYTTYIWQRGRQNRKTGNGRKIQHLHEKREEEKKCNPQTMLHWGVQCENRKKTPQHKSTYTINTWLATGGHIQLWQAAVRSSSHLLRRRSQTCSTGGGTKRSEAVDRGGE